MKFADMTPDQRRTAMQRAAGQLETELSANADAISKVMDDFDAEPAWMAASDANSPAELVARYGQPGVHWAASTTRLYQRCTTERGNYPARLPYAWASYLELAATREATRNTDWS